MSSENKAIYAMPRTVRNLSILIETLKRLEHESDSKIKYPPDIQNIIADSIQLTAYWRGYLSAQGVETEYLSGIDIAKATRHEPLIHGDICPN